MILYYINLSNKKIILKQIQVKKNKTNFEK